MHKMLPRFVAVVSRNYPETGARLFLVMFAIPVRSVKMSDTKAIQCAAERPRCDNVARKVMYKIKKRAVLARADGYVK